MKTYELRDLIWNTSVALEAIERRQKALNAFKTDQDISTRLSKRECPFCYYFVGTGMGVDGRINYNCSGCHKEIIHYGRYHYKFCNECADDFEVCKRCGADRNLNDRRRVLKKKR